MKQQEEIKTLTGGSIDYDYYLAKGRAIRSQEAHNALATFRQWMTHTWSGMVVRLKPRSITGQPDVARYPLDRPANRSARLRRENGRPAFAQDRSFLDMT